MKRDATFTKDSKVEAFRLPSEMHRLAKEKARQEDITFSQLMRRALRREIGFEIEPNQEDAA
jgi:predicted HicB family RNase H-like nuclease